LKYFILGDRDEVIGLMVGAAFIICPLGREAYEWNLINFVI